MKRILAIGLLSLSTLALGTSSHAAEPAQQGQQSQQNQQQSDKQFIRSQLGFCQYQLHAGKMAMDRSQNEQIKSLAKDQMEQAEKSIQQYETLAQAQGIQPEQQKVKSDRTAAQGEKSSTSGEHQWLTPIGHALLSDLRSKQGQDFDRAWTFQQAGAQRVSTLECQYYGQNSATPEIKQIAQQMSQQAKANESKVDQLASSMTIPNGATAGHVEQK